MFTSLLKVQLLFLTTCKHTECCELEVAKVPQSFRAESSELKQNAPFSQEAAHHSLVSALPRVYV